MKKLTIHHVHHVAKCLSCHKAIFSDNQAMITSVITSGYTNLAYARFEHFV